MAKKRVLLIGDPIIDNGANVRPGEPDVTEQLQALLRQDTVVNRALGGAACIDVLNSQISGPASEDHIVLSVGVTTLKHIDLLTKYHDSNEHPCQALDHLEFRHLCLY